MEAMREELSTLSKNGTWSLVLPPLGANLVSCRRMFKVKKHGDCGFSRMKSHLVAHGFNQVEGVDFFETFSPVVKFTTIHWILVIVVTSRWCL